MINARSIINRARCINRRFKQQRLRHHFGTPVQVSGSRLSQISISQLQWSEFCALTLFASSFACFLRGGIESCHHLIGAYFPPFFYPCGSTFIPCLRYSAIELSNLQQKLYPAIFPFSRCDFNVGTGEGHLQHYRQSQTSIRLSHHVVCPSIAYCMLRQ